MLERDSFTRRQFLLKAAAGGGSALALSQLGLSGLKSLHAQDVLPAAVPTARDAAGSEADLFVREARHYVKLEGNVVKCGLCWQGCTVPDGRRGRCGVRENREGTYYTLVYSRACTRHIDPIEKKPLFHFLPGSRAYSIATAGCNFTCKFCQNWNISQVKPRDITSIHLSPDEIARDCQKNEATCLAFTYNEPTVFFEYMHDAARQAKQVGIHPVMISNGFIRPEPMEQLLDHLSAVKIDLKSFTDKFYRETCGGRLEPVKKTLCLLKEKGAWFEIVNLIVPTLNDSEDEIKEMCEWVGETLRDDVPIHFTRFHPTYKIQNLPPTPVKTLERAHEIARETGLKHPYLGNVPGHPAENTYCPGCGKPVIERFGFHIIANRIEQGRCRECSTPIAGVWI